MRRFQSYGPSIVVAIAVAATLLFGPSAVRQLQAARTSALVTLAQDRLDNDNLLDRINDATRDIAAAVEPSVVYIETVARSQRGRSTGSGWVFDESGHIVTNAHVVLMTDEVRVQFYDGRIRRATVVGTDISTDIAVLKVAADDTLLYAARRATAAPTHQGETVFAFGSPFGFKFSMSQGIVSGLGRRAQTALAGQAYSNYIQTDAAINPGNSGGPLVDVNGRVIGMNTAIITDRDRTTAESTGVSGGIGFAIPLATIEVVVDQIITTGVVLKGYLGVGLVEFDPEVAERAGFRDGTGVIVTGVQEGQPADVAGLHEEDIITHINGERMPRMAILRSTISNMRPGEVADIRVWRDGDVLELPVELGAARVDQLGELRPVQASGRSLDDAARLDSVVESVERFGITSISTIDSGLRIESVRRGSIASEAGFRSGQVITHVGSRQVSDQDEFYQRLAVQSLAGRNGRIPVRVRSGRTTTELDLLLP